MSTKPESAVSIRKAQTQDARAIARVHVDSWKTTYKGIIPDGVLAQLSYADREQRWLRILTEGEDFVFVAEAEQDGILGFVCGGRERKGDPTYLGEVSAIYLLEAFQRRGIGRHLFERAIEELVGRGFTTMLVRVLVANTACAFYEKLGGNRLYDSEAHIAGVGYPDRAYGWKDIQNLSHAR
jgi:GNAT superfamily N-acetyltransferase